MYSVRVFFLSTHSFFFFLLFTFILKKTTVYHPFSFFFFKFTFANVLKAEITHKYKGFTEGNDVISSRSTDMIDKLKTLTAPLSGAIHCPHTTVYHHEYKKEKKKDDKTQIQIYFLRLDKLGKPGSGNMSGGNYWRKFHFRKSVYIEILISFDLS